MLTEYCKRLDNAVLRHESRYDVLGDFTSAHLSILENFSFRPGATHSAAKVQGGNHMHKVRKFVKDRPMYKKNHLDCSMYLLCGAQLMDNFGEDQVGNHEIINSKSTSSTHRIKEKLARPELLVANVSLQKSVILKRKLNEQVSEYASLVESLDKHIGKVPAGVEYANNNEDGEVLYLPLHDYGAYSQADFTRDENYMDSVDTRESLTNLQVKEATYVEDLLESQLLKRLRNTVQSSINEQKLLDEKLIPSVTRKIMRTETTNDTKVPS